MPLNRKRPFATVHGEHFAAYQQNGKLYDAAGLEVHATTGKRLEDPKLLEAEDDEPRAPGPTPIDPDDEIEGDNMDAVDLDAWERGDIKLPWQTLVAAIQRKWDVVVKSKAEATDLIRQKRAAT